jgi:sugar/nucleoside kinase (ribokinase family)
MTTSNIDVLCIGNAIVDVLARVEDGFVAKHGLVKGSMNLIDEERAEQLYGDMGQAIEVSGGSAGNTAAGVASFGGKAAYFGKVKADQLGAIFRHDMRAQGVHFDTPAALDGPATARSFILVTPDSERTMNTYLGACVNFTTVDVDPGTVQSAQVTYMEGYLWDRPEAKEAFKLAARIARAAGRKTSITLSDSFCVERHRDSFLDLIRNDIDIVFANESEIKSLYKTQNFDGAMQAIAKDCPVAVLTRSAKGLRGCEGTRRPRGSCLPREQGRRRDRRWRSLRGGLPVRFYQWKVAAGMCAAWRAGCGRSDLAYRRKAGDQSPGPCEGVGFL